jgi:hypothetical protein
MSSHPLRQAARFLLGVPTDGISRTLERMLDIAQATPLCFVAVTGPDAGEAMSVLWRKGHDRVEAARRATCRAADEQSDVLLVVGLNAVDHSQIVVIPEAHSAVRDPRGTAPHSPSPLGPGQPLRGFRDDNPLRR